MKNHTFWPYRPNTIHKISQFSTFPHFFIKFWDFNETEPFWRYRSSATPKISQFSSYFDENYTLTIAPIQNFTIFNFSSYFLKFWDFDENDTFLPYRTTTNHKIVTILNFPQFFIKFWDFDEKEPFWQYRRRTSKISWFSLYIDENDTLTISHQYNSQYFTIFNFSSYFSQILRFWWKSHILTVPQH